MEAAGLSHSDARLKGDAYLVEAEKPLVLHHLGHSIKSPCDQDVCCQTPTKHDRTAGNPCTLDS